MLRSNARRLRYTVVIQQSQHGYRVECPALPGCVSRGDSRKKALAGIKDAIRTYLLKRRPREDRRLMPELGFPLRPFTVDLAITLRKGVVVRMHCKPIRFAEINGELALGLQCLRISARDRARVVESMGDDASRED